MELDHIAEFMELAQSLNYTETADRLHLTQPTLSKHISALEHDLGAKLFKRTSTRVELTEEGYYFLGVAHNVTGELARAKEMLATMASRTPIFVDGRLDDPLISGVLSTAIARTGQGLPSVVFNHDLAHGKLDLLESGGIDLLVDIKPVQDVETRGIECVRLFSRPVIAVVDRSHPLAAAGRASIADLKEHRFVRLIGGGCDSGWDKIVALCREAGFEPEYTTMFVRSMTEGIAGAPRDCVLLYPGATKELKYLGGANRVAIALDGEDVSFGTYAMYLAANRDRLLPFVQTIRSVCDEFLDVQDEQRA